MQLVFADGLVVPLNDFDRTNRGKRLSTSWRSLVRAFSESSGQGGARHDRHGPGHFAGRVGDACHRAGAGVDIELVAIVG